MGFLGAMEVLGAASATIGCEDLLGRVGDSKHLSRGESMSDEWFVGLLLWVDLQTTAFCSSERLIGSCPPMERQSLEEDAPVCSLGYQ